MRIEVAAVLAVLLALSISASILEMWLLGLVLWCLIGLFYSDLLHMRLPDVLTFSLFCLAVIVAWVDPLRSLTEAAFFGIGAAAVFLILRWGYFRWRGVEGLGLGDVKLAAGLGALVGWQLFPLVTLIAALIGIAIALIETSKGGSPLSKSTAMPFGCYLTGATVVVMLL